MERVSGAETPAPAARTASGGEVLAWTLAAVPLATTVLRMLAAALDVAGNGRWLSALALLASLLIVKADRRRLLQSGAAAPGSLPSAWWCLVPPVYLWRRATCLGRPRLPAWGWLGSAALAFVLSLAVLAAAAPGSEPQTGAMVLPDCTGPGAAADVERTFTSLPAARSAGVAGVSVTEQEETGQGPGRAPNIRYCSALVLGSDNHEYEVDYSLELRPDGAVIRLQLRGGR